MCVEPAPRNIASNGGPAIRPNDQSLPLDPDIPMRGHTNDRLECLDEGADAQPMFFAADTNPQQTL